MCITSWPSSSHGRNRATPPRSQELVRSGFRRAGGSDARLLRRRRVDPDTERALARPPRREPDDEHGFLHLRDRLARVRRRRWPERVAALRLRPRRKDDDGHLDRRVHAAEGLAELQSNGRNAPGRNWHRQLVRLERRAPHRLWIRQGHGEPLRPHEPLAAAGTVHAAARDGGARPAAEPDQRRPLDAELSIERLRSRRRHPAHLGCERGLAGANRWVARRFAAPGARHVSRGLRHQGDVRERRRGVDAGCRVSGRAVRSAPCARRRRDEGRRRSGHRYARGRARHGGVHPRGKESHGRSLPVALWEPVRQVRAAASSDVRHAHRRLQPRGSYVQRYLRRHRLHGTSDREPAAHVAAGRSRRRRGSDRRGLHPVAW